MLYVRHIMTSNTNKRGKEWMPEKEPNLLARLAEGLVVPLAQALAISHIAPELILAKVDEVRTHVGKPYSHQRIGNFGKYRILGFFGNHAVLKGNVVLLQDVLPIGCEDTNISRKLTERRVLAALGLETGGTIAAEQFVIEHCHQLLDFPGVKPEVKNLHVCIV